MSESGGGLENVCGRGRTRVEGRDKEEKAQFGEEETRKYVGSMLWIVAAFHTDMQGMISHWQMENVKANRIYKAGVHCF